MERVEDYNGVTYNSLEEMCSAYNVRVATFKARLGRGLSLQDALDGLFVRDHLGGRFSSVRAMCKHWGIYPSTYYHRLNELGMSVQDALTSPKSVDFHYIADHLGRRFRTVEEMCSHWGITSKFYRRWLSKGFALKDILEGNVYAHEDHLGNKFLTLRELCSHWGISYSSYCKWLSKGFTSQDILEGNIFKYEDHLGNKFLTQSEMCSHWGIPYKFYLRWVSRGFSLKDILEGNIFKYEDHQGNKFSTLVEMCDYWGTTPMNYNYAMKTYGSVEIALLGAKYGSYSVRVGEVVHGYHLDECIVDFDFSSGKSSYLYKATCATCGDEIKYKAGSLLRGVKKCKVCRILKDNNITIGGTYGTLTVVKPIVVGKNKVHLLCRCSCGNMREVKPYKLKLATSRCHC